MNEIKANQNKVFILTVLDRTNNLLGARNAMDDITRGKKSKLFVMQWPLRMAIANLTM